MTAAVILYRTFQIGFKLSASGFKKELTLHYQAPHSEPNPPPFERQNWEVRGLCNQDPERQKMDAALFR